MLTFLCIRIVISYSCSPSATKLPTAAPKHSGWGMHHVPAWCQVPSGLGQHLLQEGQASVDESSLFHHLSR